MPRMVRQRHPAEEFPETHRVGQLKAPCLTLSLKVDNKTRQLHVFRSLAEGLGAWVRIQVELNG